MGNLIPQCLVCASGRAGMALSTQREDADAESEKNSEFYFEI